MVAAVHHLAPALIGRAADDIGGALAAMDGRMYGNHGAKAAIEIALHDLVGRAPAAGACAARRRLRRRVTLLGVIGGGDLDGDLRDAGNKKEDGFAIFKIKVGVDTPARDAERTRRICDLLGERHADLGRCQPGLRHRCRRSRICARSPAAVSISSSSRWRRTISPAWRRSRPQPTSRSGRTKAFMAWRTSPAITRAAPRKG